MLRKKGENCFLSELKRTLSVQDLTSQPELPTIKQLVRLLENNTCYSLQMLIDQAFITKENAYRLMNDIQNNKNILFIGATGSGKTTLLRALLSLQQEFAPDQKTVILEKFPEIKIDNEKIINNQVYQHVNSFSMEELNFLQESKDQSHLVIGEISTTNEALALASGLNSGSRIIATMHTNCWKSRLLSFIQGRSKDMYKKTISQHSFVIVHLDSSSKRHVSAIWEDQI
ncbi:ATPase, T2SS/T4P/T4SS family (plasmid) [Brevibacillus halotolerans]|nr:ATPase, T2SS/T4P/T4SS family [Brevibacillus halotolerans]